MHGPWARLGSPIVWVTGRLNRKFLLGNAAGLVLSSLVFLILYIGMYREQLAEERSAAAAQVNQLLQTSLENAMLKRDLPGLRDIVRRLGQQRDILNVMIVNPGGDVRFASTAQLLGRRLDTETDRTCAVCHDERGGPSETTRFITNELGQSVLRSVNPVHNRGPCTGCHGPTEVKPVNGVLFVDYDAAPILRHARNTTLLLLAAGVCVMLITLTGGWWFMRRFVLDPVGRLHEVSRALSLGALDARVEVRGRDELSQLGRCFNEMAEGLEQSLDELRRNREFLQGLVDAVPDGLRVIDRDYRVVLANRTYREQIGSDPRAAGTERCYASSHGRSEPCPPTLITCPLQELRPEGPPLKTVHRHQRADGSPLSVEVFAAPMAVGEGEGRETLIVESIRDLEREVRFSHEQKLSELGRLAAGIAHEIHNPLATIRLSLDRIQRPGPAGDESRAETARYLQLVDGEIDRCIAVTERLLKLSAFGGERMEIVEVNVAVEETLGLLDWEAGELGIEIHRSLDPSGPRVLAGDGDLRLAVLNLVQNAFHAMPEGGTLTVATERSEGWVRVRIEDNGHGIAPADLPHIFDPFFSRRADGHKGTGLGLSISRSNIRRYGGRLVADSTLGRGSTFRIDLPDPETDPRAV